MSKNFYLSFLFVATFFLCNNLQAQTRASFTVNSLEQCINGHNFVFTNTSTGVFNSYSWDFGDNTTSNLTSPSKVFTEPRDYNVTLIATDTTGTHHYFSQKITVHPLPVMSFAIYNGGFVGSTFNFVSTSTISSGHIASHTWDFGDGTSASGSNVNKIFATDGSFPVMLSGVSAAGCSSSVILSIPVAAAPPSGGGGGSNNPPGGGGSNPPGGGSNPAPPATNPLSFTVNRNSHCLDGNSFEFTNTTQGNFTFKWFLGDGDSTTASNPTKSYTNSGDYQVTLVGTDENGIKYFFSRTITVFPTPKVGYVLYLNTALQNIVANDTIQICNNGGTPGGGHDFQYISNSSIQRGQMLYRWNFGTTNLTYREGNDTFVNPRIIFRENGLFPVKLTVRSLEGCTDSFTHYINIIDLGSPDFTITEAPRAPFERPQITAQITTTPPAGNYSYRWNTNAVPGLDPIFGNHTTPFQFTRVTGGVNQTIQLRVSSSSGCSVTTTKTFNSLVQPSIVHMASVFNGFEPTTGRPMYHITAVGSINEFVNISLTSHLNLGEGAPVVTNSSTPNVITQLTNYTYSNAFPNDTATINFRVRNNNGNVDTISTMRFPVYAAPHAAIALRVIPRVLPTGSDTYIIRDTSTIAFGSLLAFERRYVVQILAPNNTVINQWDYVLPPNTPLNALPQFAISNPPDSYIFKVYLEYRNPHPNRFVDPAKAYALATYVPITNSGSGFTTFSSSDNATTNPQVIVVNAAGVTTANSLPELPLTVHPNPATSYANVSYTPGNTSHVIINVYTNNGALVKTQREVVAFSGGQTTRLDVSSLPPGTYIVQVLNSTATKRIGSATFIKQ